MQIYWAHHLCDGLDGTPLARRAQRIELRRAGSLVCLEERQPHLHCCMLDVHGVGLAEKLPCTIPVHLLLHIVAADRTAGQSIAHATARSKSIWVRNTPGNSDFEPEGWKVFHSGW